MKKNHFFIFVCISLIMTCSLLGCKGFNSMDNQQKVDKNDRSERTVKKEKKDIEPLTYEEEKWLMFKDEIETSLRFNWAHLLALRGKIRRGGLPQTTINQIDSLAKKYENLEYTFDHYNSKSLPNLDSFIREYNRDMKEFTRALNILYANR